MAFFLLFIIIFFILYKLWKTKVYIKILYLYKDGDDCMKITISALRCMRYQFLVPVLSRKQHEAKSSASKSNIAEKQENSKKSVRQRKTNLYKLQYGIKRFHSYKKSYHEIMKDLLVSLRCEQLMLKAVCGSQDAALTAVLTGGLWGIISILLAQIKHRIKLVTPPKVSIVPVFGLSTFELEFRCIFSLRVGNVMNASIRLFKRARGK